MDAPEQRQTMWMRMWRMAMWVGVGCGVCAAALSKPDDPEFQEMLGWVGAVGFDPKGFDVNVINQGLLKL